MPAPQTDDARKDRFCRYCGEELTPGGVRDIGVCEDCIANSRYRLTKIPRVSYGRKHTSE